MRLLPKSHGSRFRHRRDAVRGSLRQNDDSSPSKRPEGNLREGDKAMCASGAYRAAKGLYVGALASFKRAERGPGASTRPPKGTDDGPREKRRSQLFCVRNLNIYC